MVLLCSTPKAWIGQQPQALLNAYTSLCCSRTVPIYQVVRNPTPEDFTPSFLAAENGGPGLTDVASTMVCTVAVHPAGHDSALKARTRANSSPLKFCWRQWCPPAQALPPLHHHVHESLSQVLQLLGVSVLLFAGLFYPSIHSKFGNGRWRQLWLRIAARHL